MSELTTPITKIQSNDGQSKIHNIGALFKNVYLEEKDNQLVNYTLENLYTELQQFFNTGNFICYSEDNPMNEDKTNSPAKIWFQLIDENEEDEGSPST